MATRAIKDGSYRFGVYVLDTAESVVRKGGKIVPLPPKAISILTLLIENAGQVIDKKTIFSRVWPDTFVVESSLTKNISLLRSSLPLDGERLIETVAKRGYRFAATLHPEAPTEYVVINERPIYASRTPPQWTIHVGSFSKRLIGFSAITVILFALASFGPFPFRELPATAAESRREYLIAEHISDRMERSEAEKALARFERAARLDDRSAAAWAGIAQARITMVTLGVGQTVENLTKAKEAASRALDISRDFAPARVNLGVVRLMRDFDVAGAEIEYRRALGLDSESVEAQFRYSCLLTHAGRTGEARRMIRQAIKRNPVSAKLACQAAKIEYFDRRYSQAAGMLQELLERDPSFSQAHYYLAMCLGRMGRTREALHHLLQSRLSPTLVETDTAWLKSVEGDKSRAAELLNLRRRKMLDGEARPTILVLPAIDSGDYQTALWALDRMWSTREVELLSIKVDPRFDALRGEAGFRQLIGRIWPADIRLEEVGGGGGS